MIRNLKALGLALVAMFALGAVVASAASAQTVGKITSTGPVTLDITPIAGQTNAFTYPGFSQRVECPTHKLTGHKTLTTTETEGENIGKENEVPPKKHELIPSGSSTATITAHYETCHSVNEKFEETHKVTVTMNGCDYDFRIGETTGEGVDTYGVEADLVCPAGKVVEVEIYPFAGSELGGVVCRLTIGAQTGLKGPHLTGITPKPHDIELRGTLTGIHVTRDNLGGCPQGEETTTKAELHVAYTIKGTNANHEETEITLSH
jgi:hypothetical protein